MVDDGRFGAQRLLPLYSQLECKETWIVWTLTGSKEEEQIFLDVGRKQGKRLHHFVCRF